jgi:RimJ/RimL family protein N-acetyltransferase
MLPISTERLTLRDFREDDYEAVHSYASVNENVAYMEFGPNKPDDTRAFIRRAMDTAAEHPRKKFELAVILTETGDLIGSCDLHTEPDNSGKGEVGWLLHRDYWQQGYGPELGRALLALGFDVLGLHRIVARCDAENYGSYRVMEKIGMRKEGLFIEARPANKLSPEKQYADELHYAITKQEWDIRKAMDYYNGLPITFDGFIDIPMLTDGELYLLCYEKKPAEPERKRVPAYMFAICRAGEKVGEISLRIGYTDGLYYGGQIGYGIDEEHRGHGYAARACRLLTYVAKAHGMKKLLITNDERNEASRRVCEKLGAKHVLYGRVPEWHDLYKEGHRYGNIYEWSLE